MMSRTLIFGLIFAFILQFLAKINSSPLVSDIERESVGKQLEFPNENEIPSENTPGERPSFPSIPRQWPGIPRRGTQSDGLLNRIVNFFKSVLGIGTPTVGPDGEVDVGVGDSGSGGGSGGGGILNFIRRTFSGLINRFMSVFNGNGAPGANPDAADFPYQRPRMEPLRARN